MQEIIQTHNLDITQIFKNFDKDHGGDLSEKEFYKMMLVIDPRITHYEAVYLFKKVDRDGSGSVLKKKKLIRILNLISGLHGGIQVDLH